MNANDDSCVTHLRCEFPVYRLNNEEILHDKESTQQKRKRGLETNLGATELLCDLLLLLLLCLFFVVSRHDEKESLPTSTNHKKMIHELR